MGGVWGWKVGAREKEKTQESSLCESPRCSLVHCAVCCQVKLGSTGSVSVKKSILDGRLLPGKSVLIPGLILDQRLRWNDMPLGPKMNTFGSGNWMEMCQVIAPAACFALLESERGRESAWGGKRSTGGRCGGKKPRIRRPLGIHFQASPRPSGVLSGPLLFGSCKCTLCKVKCICPLAASLLCVPTKHKMKNSPS